MTYVFRRQMDVPYRVFRSELNSWSFETQGNASILAAIEVQLRELDDIHQSRADRSMALELSTCDDRSVVHSLEHPPERICRAGKCLACFEAIEGYEKLDCGHRSLCLPCLRKACILALKEDDYACYARCPVSECLQVLSPADVLLARLSTADTIGLREMQSRQGPEGLHMVPSFVRPEADQDVYGDQDILLLHALACQNSWARCKCGFVVEKVGGCGHVKCRCGRHFCYLCNADLSENRSTCTLCLSKQSQPQTAVAAQAAAAAAPRALVDVTQYVTLIEGSWVCRVCGRTRNCKKQQYTRRSVQHHVRHVHLNLSVCT